MTKVQFSVGAYNFLVVGYVFINSEMPVVTLLVLRYVPKISMVFIKIECACIYTFIWCECTCIYERLCLYCVSRKIKAITKITYCVVITTP